MFFLVPGFKEIKLQHVSPCTESDDEVMYHNYYQWVSYLLFIQSLRWVRYFSEAFLTIKLLHQLFHATESSFVLGERSRSADPRRLAQHHNGPGDETGATFNIPSCNK